MQKNKKGTLLRNSWERPHFAVKKENGISGENDQNAQVQKKSSKHSNEWVFLSSD